MCQFDSVEYYALTHTVPLPIILVKSTMVQSTGNNIGRDKYTIPLNFNNGPVPRYELMLWSGFQWVKHSTRPTSKIAQGCLIALAAAKLDRTGKCPTRYLTSLPAQAVKLD